MNESPTTLQTVVAVLNFNVEAKWSAVAGIGRVYVSEDRWTRKGRRSSPLGYIEIDPVGRAVHHLTREVRAISEALAKHGILLHRPSK